MIMQKKKNNKKPSEKTVKNTRQASTKGGSRNASRLAAQSTQPPQKLKDKILFVFRKYKKIEGGKIKRAKHPKLIVDEENDNYGFMGLTESPKRGHHKNIKLSKNPQVGNTSDSYLRDELRYDLKENFSDILEDYNLSEEDKIAVLEYIKKRKKKK